MLQLSAHVPILMVHQVPPTHE